MDPLHHGRARPDPIDRLHLPLPHRHPHQRNRPHTQLQSGPGRPHRSDDDGRDGIRDVVGRVDHPTRDRQRDVVDHLRLDPQPVPLHLRANLGQHRGHRPLRPLRRHHPFLPAHDRGDHLHRPGAAPDSDPVRQAG